MATKGSTTARGTVRGLKVGIALCASTVGILLPGRARVVYSELLGWVAQLVPPRFYQVDTDGEPERP